MFHTILNILMWFFIGLLALVVGFWIYGMITDKNFCEANFEGWKASQYKNRKQKGAEKIQSITSVRETSFLVS